MNIRNYTPAAIYRRQLEWHETARDSQKAARAFGWAMVMGFLVWLNWDSSDDLTRFVWILSLGMCMAQLINTAYWLIGHFNPEGDYDEE